jgi:hypothetical protein
MRVVHLSRLLCGSAARHMGGPAPSQCAVEEPIGHGSDIHLRWIGVGPKRSTFLLWLTTAVSQGAPSVLQGGGLAYVLPQ